MPTIFAYPKDAIAHTRLLYAAMQRKGEVVEEAVLSMRWFLEHQRRGDVLHVHWPSFGYNCPTRFALLVAFARWMFILTTARLRGVRIFWTAHNLLPHDRAPLPIVDVWARHFMIAIASGVFVHGREAGARLVARFPRAAKKLAYIPLGNLIGFYPTNKSRDEAREIDGHAPSTFVFLFVGLCKPYKNLETLIDAFNMLVGDAALVIAGKFQSADYQRRIEAKVKGFPRIRLASGYIPDDSLADYLIAADAVVAPYRETLTSGVAILAMSYGRPIVSVAVGHLLDIVDDAVGVLYEGGDAESLAAAMNRVRERSFDEDRIVRHAERFTFDDAATESVRVFWQAASKH